MNAPQFRQAVTDAKRDELDDFASDRLLSALAGGTVTRARLLRAMADSEHAARETFRLWADDESDPDAREAFATVARQEDDHRERVLTVLDESYEPNDGGPLHTYLRGREDTVQRLASGLVARPLVSVASYTRLVEFFEGETSLESGTADETDGDGDEDAAELARDLRAETAEVVDDALPLLDSRCDTSDDWARARMAAEYTITVAHDDFLDGLRSAGAE